MDGKFRGTLRMGQMMSNTKDGDFIQLELEDESSHSEVLRVNITLLQFGVLLGTARGIKIDYELFSKLAGTRHEHVRRQIVVPDKIRHKCQRVQDIAMHLDEVKDVLEFVRSHEDDGWKMSIYDLGNSHNLRSSAGLKDAAMMDVSFHRYVDPTTGKPVEVE